MFNAKVTNSGVASVAPLQPPAPRPRVRARRGQATDPHSIAERVMSCDFVVYLLKFSV